MAHEELLAKKVLPHKGVKKKLMNALVMCIQLYVLPMSASGSFYYVQVAGTPRLKHGIFHLGCCVFLVSCASFHVVDRGVRRDIELQLVWCLHSRVLFESFERHTDTDHIF